MQQKIEGVVILGVAPGGAADQAGIRGAKPRNGGFVLGDVIVKVDNVEVKRVQRSVPALDTHKVGDEVEVTVESDGNRRVVKVTLQALP